MRPRLVTGGGGEASAHSFSLIFFGELILLLEKLEKERNILNADKDKMRKMKEKFELRSFALDNFRST